MTCKTHKTIALVAVAALMIPAVIAAVTYADQQQRQQDEQEHHEDANSALGPVGSTEGAITPPESNTTMTDTQHSLTQEEINMRVNELADKISRLYFENHDLYAAVSDESVLDRQSLDKIKQNNQTMQTLQKELDMLYPILPDIHISDEDITLMESAMLSLTQTDLLLYGMGINHATGTLDLIAYIDKAYPGLEDDIKEHTKDIPIVITYSKNAARLQ